MPNRAGIIQGLQILEKYDEDGYCSADHDILYSCVEVEVVTPEDAETLKDIGWHVSSESGTWAAFV